MPTYDPEAVAAWERAHFYHALNNRSLPVLAQPNGKIRGTLDPENTGDVKDAQRKLKAAGYSVPTSGLFDQATMAAVIDFKNANGLGGTPYEVDAATWMALDRAQGTQTAADVSAIFGAFTKAISGSGSSSPAPVVAAPTAAPATNWVLIGGVVGGVVVLGGIAVLLLRN